jgi:hypothetical protein
MALISCKECGQTVSTEAAVCPHCGAPQRPPVPPPLPASSEERVIYRDNLVAVTTTRVIVGGATYALRNVTSVAMTYTPPQRALPLLMLIIGLFFLALSWIFSEKQQTPVFGYIFLGAWIAGAILWMAMIKTQFHVNLSSASGEIHAITSKEKSYVECVVVSINEAIAKDHKILERE